MKRKRHKKYFISYKGLFSLLLLFLLFLVVVRPAVFYGLDNGYSHNEYLAYSLYPNIAEMIKRGSNWLAVNQTADGNFLYKFNHLTGLEDNSTSSVRQVGGIYAVNYVAKRFPGPLERLSALKGLEYLKRNIVIKKGIGYYSLVKNPTLGHAGIALLAFLESPYSNRYNREINSLANFIFSMQKKDGSFYTHYPNITVKGSVEYFPGEGLLGLAVFYEKTGNKAALDSIERALPYYEKHFDRKPTTAFYTWHAQAFSKAYKATGKKEFKDFVFKLTDWILKKRFDGLGTTRYKGKRYSGITTAVYSEGLAEAYSVALLSGDKQRIGRYKRALAKAFTHIKNLQSSYYPEKREYGGFYSTSFDPIVRVDNTQHAVVALIKMVEYRLFFAG